MNTKLEGKKIYTFTVLYEGWEMDNEAWVVEDQAGNRWIETTSHGSKYVATVEEFRQKAKEYKTVLDQTEKALELVSGNMSI